MSGPDLTERRRRLMEAAPKMGDLLLAQRPEPKKPRFQIKINWWWLLPRVAIVLVVIAIVAGAFLRYRSQQKEFIYQTAMTDLEARDWEASRSALDQLEAVDPQYADVRALRCETYYRPAIEALDAGQMDRAVDLIAELNLLDLAYKDIPDRVQAQPELRQALLDRYADSWLKGDVVSLLTITGHYGGNVTSVDISPDGRSIASTAGDDNARMWNLSTGQGMHALVGHQRFPQSVKFSPDGRTLATGSWDDTVKLWDVVGGQDLHTFTGHKGIVWSIDWAPDGKSVASGSSDRTVRIWDTVEGRQVAQLEGHQDNVKAVAYSPDGKMLASGGEDGAVVIWDPATHKEAKKIRYPAKVQVMSLAFSPDGKILAVGRSDGVVTLLDTSTWEERGKLLGNERLVMGIAFYPTGQIAATAGWDDTVRLWNMATGEQIREITRGFGVVQGLDFAPDGKALVSGHAAAQIKVWQPK